jgi:signal transduction histidine kinase
VKRLWPLGRRYFFEVAVVLAATGGVVEMVFASRSFDPEAPDASLPVLISAILLMTLPLLARRRFPFAAPATTVIAASVFSFVEGEFIPFSGVGFLTLVVVAFLFGLVRDRRQAAAGLALAYATMIVVHWNEPDGALGDVAFVAIIFSLLWVAGLALGHKLAAAAEAEERAARLEREREERARAAVEEERARIARELHDVVGHSVSVMTVQAGAVRRLLRPEQEREREALLVVEHTGREALAEMRRMVGVLRHPEEAPALAPQPGLEQLARLVAQAREAGLPVELRVEGEPAPLPPGVDLAAYRAVQEGLTNARKHAGAGRVEVVVRYADSRVELLVVDDGRGNGSGDGLGHGLAGMRERVALYGGEFEAGPRPEGGYALRVSLPLTAEV